MRITLMHNPSAGHDEHHAHALVKALKKADFKVDYQSTKKKKWAKALEEPGDLVVVAGGDGTVGKVVRRLAGREVPVAILPLGTANNIATALGIRGEVEELIDGWRDGPRRRLDVGTAVGPWGETRFVEAVGMGLFPQTMAIADSREEHDAPDRREEELRRSVRFLEMSLASARTRNVELVLDGEELSGNFFLLEAMNIPYVGPNLPLAPDAGMGDGKLDVVCIREEDRACFTEYLEQRMAGERAALDLPVRRARHLRILWDGAPLHIDDRIHADGTKSDTERVPVEVRLDSHVEVLLGGA